MGYAILHQPGGGGLRSEDVTASKAQVLAGYTALTNDSGDEAVEGTMVNRGAVNQSLGINGEYTIPQGYHNGSGKVSQTVPTKGAETYYPGTSQQKIASGRYLTGEQIIAAVGQENLSAGNIRNGTTVKITNGNGDIYSVTGNYTGTKHMMSVAAAQGFGEQSAYWNQGPFEASFTMPQNGVLIYGGFSAGVSAGSASPNVVCEVYVNNTRIDHRNINSEEDYAWRASMVNKTRSVNKGDVIKIRAATTVGSSAMAFIQAMCIY